MAGRLTSAQLQAYRSAGALPFAGSLPLAQVAPAREVAGALARQAPDQDFLSGVHNPFGHHALTAQAWSFLDIAENSQLLDRVEDVIGPDIVLWDSELYFDLSSLAADEGECWPVEPLAGALAVVSLEQGDFGLIDIGRLPGARAGFAGRRGADFVIRYMPATSHFNRDPAFAANRRAAEARPLVNYAIRPIWLLRGADRADNDFATGFMVPAPRWTNASADGGAMRDDSNRVRPERI
ncbi:MAG: resolvase [Xanthobacteraceae bacterium]|jgi:hypothetical protein